MANQSGPVIARFDPTDEFQKLYRSFRDRHPAIVEPFHTFVRRKIERPPADLPRGMRDHHLTGDLAGFRECHLAADILLIYTDKNNVVRPLLICQHDDLYGPRGKAVKRRIREFGERD